MSINISALTSTAPPADTSQGAKLAEITTSTGSKFSDVSRAIKKWGAPLPMPLKPGEDGPSGVRQLTRETPPREGFDKALERILRTPYKELRRIDPGFAQPLPGTQGNDSQNRLPSRAPRTPQATTLGPWPIPFPIFSRTNPPSISLEVNGKQPTPTPVITPTFLSANTSSVFLNPVQQTAARSVVNLAEGGSGVIVANKGNEYVLLTNEHCLKRGAKVGAKVDIVLPSGEKITGKVVALGHQETKNGYDLAAVKFTSQKPLTVSPIAKTEPAAGQKMFAIGFPFEGTTTASSSGFRVDSKTGQTISDGSVVRNLPEGKQINGSYGLVSTARVTQGMSGGGNFDAASGELIGLSGRGGRPIMPASPEEGRQYDAAYGSNGKSLAISASEIRQFLSINKKTVPEWAGADRL